jgi:hypothetical protein
VSLSPSTLRHFDAPEFIFPPRYSAPRGGHSYPCAMYSLSPSFWPVLGSLPAFQILPPHAGSSRIVMQVTWQWNMWKQKWNLDVAYRYSAYRYMEVDRWNLSFDARSLQRLPVLKHFPVAAIVELAVTCDREYKTPREPQKSASFLLFGDAFADLFGFLQTIV